MALPDYVQQAASQRNELPDYVKQAAGEQQPNEFEMAVAKEPPMETVGEEPKKEQFSTEFWDRVNTRVQKTGEMVDRQLEGNLLSDIMNIPKIAALTTGQIAGVGVDIIGEGIKRLVGPMIPEPVKEAAKEKGIALLQTDIGKKGLDAISKGQEAWERFEEKNPDGAMALSGIVNIASLGVTQKSAAVVEKEIIDVAKDSVALMNKVNPGRIESKIFNVVKNGIQKGARPGVAGKRTFSQTQNYFNQANKAVKSIVARKKALKLFDNEGFIVEGVLPENLSQFSQAIQQTKKAVFSEYDKLAKLTDEAVDLKPIVKQLRIAAKNKAMQAAAPDVAEYSLKVADELGKVGKVSASTAQDIVQIYNTRLEAFMANPSYDVAVKKGVDAMVANSIRKKLDNVINSSTGKQYSALKREYGALKAIEKDVNRRAIVDMRQDVKGLIDFSDIFTGGQLIQSVMTKNPAAFAQAATSKGIAAYYKKLKDPNRAIKTMFEAVEKLEGKKGAFVPKSQTFKKASEMKEIYDYTTGGM
jgi:hypothetical protein